MPGDEFDDDDIDWAALDLPPASAPLQANNHNSSTSQYDDVSQPHTAGQHQAVNNSQINNHVNPSTNISASTNNTTENHPTTKSLQNQIIHLQALLASKSSRISELETTAESTLAAQKAETEARNRMHLMEEELRRVKREADQYKGQWVRVKKRVAELEQGAQAKVGGGNRAITPNVDHFHHHFGDGKEKYGDDDKMEVEERGKGVKRKSEEHGNDPRPDEKQEKAVVSWGGIAPQVLRHDSVRERVAKHLLLRDEAGSYSWNSIIKKSEKEYDTTDSRTVDQVEHETKQFVKSILCHMATDPISTQNNDSRAMSVSGLLRVLLERFNTLFYAADTTTSLEKLDAPEMDVDQPENERKSHDLVINVLSNRKQVNHATQSSRAVLYLLHIMHDVLNLSAIARDDLRWWFYKARQSEDTEGDASVETVDKYPENRGHPRIEGLPSNINLTHIKNHWSEALWSTSCRPIAEGDGWDASTMTSQCNVFFEILVGLMKGTKPIKSQGAFVNENNKILEFAQIKSIEFVSCLMSDAAPYNHFEPNAKHKTPYIWKFWFDSLFPSYSSSGTISDSSTSGDFFSIWEKGGGSQRENFLGQGRRYNTQLIMRAAESEDVPTKQSGGKQSSRVDKSKSIGTAPASQRDADGLVVDIKCKSLQLITHFITSSTSLHQSMYNVHKQPNSAAKEVSLAKRVIFAVLDDLDELAIPLLLSSHDFKENPTDFSHILELCHSCVMFLLVLSQTDAGIYLFRIQTKLDLEVGDVSRWSSSAIGCVTALLDALLLRMDKFVENQSEGSAAHYTSPIKSIVEKCMLFYKNLLLFVHNQSHARSKSKATSMLALVAEQRNVFVSCCHKVIALQGLSEDIKYEARLLLEEVMLDGDT